jgi:hypothetical protein
VIDLLVMNRFVAAIAFKPLQAIHGPQATLVCHIQIGIGRPVIKKAASLQASTLKPKLNDLF